MFAMLECRVLHLYEMGREDGYGGKGACNPALNCAEDLCHCFCRGERTFCLDKDQSLNQSRQASVQFN